MKKISIMVIMSIILFASCQNKTQKENEPVSQEPFEFVADRFGDIEIMRYQVDGWDELSLQEKELIYYLSEAALCGRDIIFDQNCKYNLVVNRTLDNIVRTYKGDQTTDEWNKFMVYVKRFWFSNGMHHHYSNAKFFPEISKSYFDTLLNNSDITKFPIIDGDKAQFFNAITDIIFNPDIAPVKICQDNSKDLIVNSACNFYEGVTQKEVENYYNTLIKNNNTDPERPISFGLNSKVIKDAKGNVIEDVYKIGGLYGQALVKVVYWLQKAATVAENESQKNHINKLIEYYNSGDLKTWDEYNILWASDLESKIDYVNGFIEVYNDPMGQKATWESVVNFKDAKNSKRAEVICKNAQWFEDNSPIDPQFKKKEVKGVVAKVITVAQLGGECYPATPIGINLPNANWIRKEYGSKSVTMENIMYAYSQAKLKSGAAKEFYYSDAEIELTKKYGYISDNIQVDLHECLGHGSGQMLPGVGDGQLKNYHSAIEETRADLFSLYYIADPKMVELGLLPDAEAYKACYYKYILNGMMLQLNRIDLGSNITQAHMRNRAIIARWCYEQGLKDNVIEIVVRDGKRFVKINDYLKLRELFGALLKEVQTIKSSGNYEAAKKLVENYGVSIDIDLHKEIKERYATLDVAPYGGFINPQFTLKKEGEKIVDILIEYPSNYTQQMLDYNEKYNFLIIK